ncbi:MAG: proline dehydrogenase family protein [Elusimicrobia bacterium]|nr:proline dehydrogenase family protein [Elusimicrobiota bacterium]
MLPFLLCAAAALAGPVVERPEDPRPVAELRAAPTLPANFEAGRTLTPDSAFLKLGLIVPVIVETGPLPAPSTLPGGTPQAKGHDADPAVPASRREAALALEEPAVSFDGARHIAARAALLTQRAATLPAHLWPFSNLAKKLSHGEGLAGLTPSGAVAAARKIRSDHRAPAVIGRLSWELHDVWSVRGAVRSYARLIDAVAEAKSKDPKVDVSISLDVESLGAQLDGLSFPEKTRIAIANATALARRARDRGIAIEFDMGASAVMPLLLDVARSVVRKLGTPARLALSARYLASEEALRNWSALARETGLRLGVRLVKGSFIEGDKPGTLYFRRALLEQYKKLITQALEQGDALDVAVATHNEEIWEHAEAQSRRLGAPYSLQVIRGVNRKLQRRMRASGNIPREYVSYGVDTPVMALMEWWTNWRQKRALRRRVDGELD